MSITPSADRLIQEKKKLVQQFIVDPDFLVPGVHIEPFTPHLQINSFVQRALSHSMGRYATDKKWYPLAVDDEGKLILSDVVTNAGYVALGNREAVDYVIFTSQSVPATSLVTHAGIDVSSFSGKTMLISSTASVTIYVQMSNDGTNWYDLQDETDTARTYTCDNEKIAIGIDDYCHYIRIVIYNATAAAIDVDGALMCVV